MIKAIYSPRFILQPVYQPNGEILFSEVLARFESGNTQHIILEAEQDGSIFEIDKASLHFGIDAPQPVSVNVSQRSIKEHAQELIELVQPGLIVEITETYEASLTDLNRFAAAVHARGGLIALDDVGAGSFESVSAVYNVIAATKPQYIKLGLDADIQLIRACQNTGIDLIFELVMTRGDVQTALEYEATGMQGWFFNGVYGMSWLQQKRMTAQRALTSSLQLMAA